ncbi:MAG: WYL domain-containing protein [Lachnospiraceae bacterium]
MPKGTNQKLKLYYLMKIMLEKTDDDHCITMPEIIAALDQYGVSAERKSIYTDLADLEKMGVDVIGEPFGKTYHYHLGSRQFELAELKLLVDAIQSSKFITARKSNELIHKLETMCSEYEAKELQRQVYVSGRIKTMNESIYYNVDYIHNAIGHNRKILFQYFQWNTKKKMELRHDGEYYHISPWGLSWDDENYYLVGYDSENQMIKHYRVDKMVKIKMSEETRDGKKEFKEFDVAAYAKKSFAMYGGKEENVKLLMDNCLAGVVIDRFGKDVHMVPANEDQFTTIVDVAVSRPFISWVFSLGPGATIIGPESVVNQVHEEIQRLTTQY